LAYHTIPRSLLPYSRYYMGPLSRNSHTSGIAGARTFLLATATLLLERPLEEHRGAASESTLERSFLNGRSIRSARRGPGRRRRDTLAHPVAILRARPRRSRHAVRRGAARDAA